jgi:hypothetical protein
LLKYNFNHFFRVATHKIENKELKSAFDRFLNVGEWVVDQSILIMSNSVYFERKR